MSNKKLTYVIYYRNDDLNIIETLESIKNQNTHVTDYDVIVLNDSSSDDDEGTKKVKKFIDDNKLINFNILEFDKYLGISWLFSFLNRARLIKSEYITFLRSGDKLNKGWASNFLNNLYPLKMDMYLHDFDKIMHCKKIIKKKNKLPIVKEFSKKIKYSPVSSLEGEIERNAAISTLHFFFGKVFKYSKIAGMRVFTERIIYQDLYIYQKMISLCSTFYYCPFNAGKIEHKPWYEAKMDKDRIVLFCKTIDRMISKKNVVLNGMLLQMLAVAIKHTEKLDYYYYIISNFKYLHKNAKLISIKGIDVNKFKAKKLTKNIVKTGKLLILKK